MSPLLHGPRRRGVTSGRVKFKIIGEIDQIETIASGTGFEWYRNVRIPADSLSRRSCEAA